MSKVNYDKMSVAQIDDLIAEALAAKADKISEKRRELRAQFAKEAAERGFDLAELVSGMKAKKTDKRTGKATYRNPANPSETWTGWGRRPRWLEGQLKAGKQLDHFRA